MIPEPGVQREVGESDVAELAGGGQAICAERLANAGLGVIRTMNVEMEPPRTVVVVQVMIRVPRIDAESERIGRHDAER